MKSLAITFFFVFYKSFSLILGAGACRHSPTCSEYARQAFEKHNLAFAFFLSIKRLISCHPLSHGGYDPVP